MDLHDIVYIKPFDSFHASTMQKPIYTSFTHKWHNRDYSGRPLAGFKRSHALGLLQPSQTTGDCSIEYQSKLIVSTTPCRLSLAEPFERTHSTDQMR